MEKRYGLEKLEEGHCKKKEDALELLQLICKSRHCYLKGEELDIARAAAIAVDDFRSGKLGRITLEFPDTATQGI